MEEGEWDGKVTTLVHPIVLKDVDTDLPKGTPEDQKPFLRGLAVDARGNVYAAATGCAGMCTPARQELAARKVSPHPPQGSPLQTLLALGPAASARPA